MVISEISITLITMNEKDDKKVKHYWMMALWLSYISLNSSKYYALVKGFNFFFFSILFCDTWYYCAKQVWGLWRFFTWCTNEHFQKFCSLLFLVCHTSCGRTYVLACLLIIYYPTVFFFEFTVCIAVLQIFAINKNKYRIELMR